MPTDIDSDWDGQDQAEAFDEDNLSLDGEGQGAPGMMTLDELPDVFDVTRADGDTDDDDALIGEELDDDEIIDLEADADEADDESFRATEAASFAREDNEADIGFIDDLDRLANTEDESAAAMEADSLSDDDLDELGYDGLR